MSAIIFKTYQQRSRSGGPTLAKVGSEDAVISSLSLPKIKGVSSKTCVPSASLVDAIGDASLTLRTAPLALSQMVGESLDNGAAPLVGFTSVLGCVTGVGRARDSLRQMRDYERIGDTTGAHFARAQIVENSFLVGGSAGLAGVRIFGAIQVLCQLLSEPIVLSPAWATVQAVSSWISTALFSIFYLLFAGRQVATLIGLSKGDEFREKLLQSSDQIQALKDHIDIEMFNGSAFTEDECTEMALQEGANWLKKLEKKGEEFPWEPTDESRREHALALFLSHPEFMMAEIDKPYGFDRLSPEGKMIAFGRFVGEKRLCEKIVHDLKRELGPEAVEALVKEDRIALEKGLKSARWSEWGIRWKTVLKIGLAVASMAALIAGVIVTGGLALSIALLVLGVVGLLWIVFFDGTSFKAQWASEKVGKWDKFVVGLSVVLSAVSLGALITLTVLSGGAPLFIAGVIFAAAWMVVTLRTCYKLIDHLRHPWKSQGKISVRVFRKFLETKPTEKEIEMVLMKMPLQKRKVIQCGARGMGYEEAARVFEESLKAYKKTGRDLVMKHLREASIVVEEMKALQSEEISA